MIDNDLLDALKFDCLYFYALGDVTTTDAIQGFALNRFEELLEIINRYDKDYYPRMTDEQWDEFFPF